MVHSLLLMTNQIPNVRSATDCSVKGNEEWYIAQSLQNNFSGCYNSIKHQNLLKALRL